MRHGGRSAAAISAGFSRFPNLELHEKRDIQRHLPEARGVDRQGRHQCRQAVAMPVPRCIRTPQMQFRGERFTHRQTLCAQCGQGSAGAAELHAGGLVEAAGHAPPTAPYRAQPPCRLQPKRDRRGRLQQGAPQHHRAGMLVRDPPQRARHAQVVRFQHTRGTRLAAAPWPCPSRPGWWRPNARNRPPTRSACAPVRSACAPAESPECRRARPAAPVPPYRSLRPRPRARWPPPPRRGSRPRAPPPAPAPLRNRACIAARPHPRRPATTLPVADRLSINRVNMYRSYTSKKTVSASPCRRISISHRSACPAAGRASRVARRSSGTSASAASPALAGSPAK